MYWTNSTTTPPCQSFHVMLSHLLQCFLLNNPIPTFDLLWKVQFHVSLTRRGRPMQDTVKGWMGSKFYVELLTAAAVIAIHHRLCGQVGSVLAVSPTSEAIVVMEANWSCLSPTLIPDRNRTHLSVGRGGRRNLDNVRMYRKASSTHSFLYHKKVMYFLSALFRKYYKGKKETSSMARSIPVENLLSQDVGSIINYLQ